MPDPGPEPEQTPNPEVTPEPPAPTHETAPETAPAPKPPRPATPAPETPERPPAPADAENARYEPSLRLLVTGSLIATAIVPVAVFGLIVVAAKLGKDERVVDTLLVGSVAGAAFFGLLAAAVAVARITSSLRRITVAVERVAAGESSPPIHMTGDDELARLAESHNRIAAEAQRRNRELADLLHAIAGYSPAQGVPALAAQAEADACSIFGLIDSRVVFVDPATVRHEERIPGDPQPVRAAIRAGTETLGLLTGHLPATRSWERADQDLLDLFTGEVGVAIRNADLFVQIEKQNARLLELDAAKDEFLRGISHNLQTPLTSIRAYVDQIRTSSSEAAADRRLQIIAEQADRLTRMVRQLLTVTKLEAGVLRQEVEVIAMGPRIRRAWEALNASTVEFEVRDHAQGWLAVADPDQLDQVLWALLDNAVKYGGREGKIEVDLRADVTDDKLDITISDHGAGVADEDRGKLFTRFTRGSAMPSGDGTGLGLYVSRQLLRKMDGDLVLEPARAGFGACFTISLPGEPPGDAD